MEITQIRKRAFSKEPACRKKWWQGLSLRLLALVLVPVLPALILSVWTNIEQRKQATKEMREEVVRLAELAAAQQEGILEGARQLLSALAQLPQVHGANRLACHNLFSGLLKLYSSYDNFGLIESNGEVFASALPPREAVSLADRSYFKKAVQTGRFAVGDFQIGRLTKNPTLNLGYPIQDTNGTVVRVLYAAIDLSAFNKMAARANLPAGAVLKIIDRNGSILARYPDPDQWVGRSAKSSALGQRILLERQGACDDEGIDGVARSYGFAALQTGSEPSLFACVGIQKDLIYAQSNWLLIRNLGVLIFVAFAALLLAKAFADFFVLRPLQTLVASAAHIAQGNLTARVSVDKGSWELNQLAERFNQMAEAVQQRQQEIEASTEQIRRLNADLEERVQARTAELEAANQELEAFSYSVSHDLRAPLRHINGYVDLFSKRCDRLDESSRRYLSIISESAKQMGRLIDDLLVFSRMARMDLQQGTVDLNAIVRQAIGALREETQHRQIEWKVSPLPAVRGDSAMLRQVWVNLISNAAKYTRPRAMAVIEIAARESSDELVFWVRDNGVGFDMRYAAKLFGVFQRLHRAEEFEGTGIGLANVRRIIHRHHGRAWAESSPDAGATFYFSLPKPAPTPS